MKKTYYNSGFTLVEVIVAMFIFSIIVASVSVFSGYYLKNYSYTTEETQSIGLAQSGLTQMIHEIRAARNGEDGSWPIITADDNQLILFADVNGDGLTEKVRYFLNGTVLQKGVIQATAVPVTYPAANEKISVVTTNIDTTVTPIFRYYNDNWPSDTTNNPLTPTNRISNTRYITVNLQINITSNYGSQPFQLTSGVAIRSMKDNL